MYASRRPQVFLPRKTLFLPNALGIDPLSVAAFTAASALTANRAYYIGFSAPFDTGLVDISVYCTAQSGQNFDFGLYDASGNRLTSRGSTAISATGVRTWTLSTPYSLTADTMYYAAFAVNSATPTFTVSPAATIRNPQTSVLVQDTAFALPLTWTAAYSGNVVVPVLRLTFSG